MSAAKKAVRFLHTSDWQLGMTRHFLSEEAAPRFAQARVDAIEQLGKLAQDHNADFIVVAGDVFESNHLKRQTVDRTIEALKEVRVPIFLLPGNHDPLDASSIFSTPKFKAAGEQILVIRDTEPIPVPGLDGVEVVGAPWRTKHPSSDLCADMLAKLEPSDDKLRVAVCHGQTEEFSGKTPPGNINLANAEAALLDGRIHYLALGDRHSVKNVGKTGRVWFSGAPVATDFNETRPNQTLLVELSSDQWKVDELQVGTWNFIVKEFNLNGPSDLEMVAKWLDDLPNKKDTVVKVAFKGTVNLITAERLDRLFDDHVQKFASLRKRERTSDLTIAPDKLDKDSVALSGYAKGAWDELLANVEDDPKALGALRLFYRLIQPRVPV